MSVNNYIEAALAVHAAASVITALTPTPKDDAFVVKAYRIIELCALVVGRAKEPGTEKRRRRR
jgi:hypothetical protein